MSTCRASCADRFGRNPKLHGRNRISRDIPARSLRGGTSRVSQLVLALVVAVWDLADVPSPFARQDVVMPSQKKYPVTLAAEDREALERVTRTGVHPASVIRRARLLLALDTAVGAVEDRVVIAEQAGVSCETVRLVSTRSST